MVKDLVCGNDNEASIPFCDLCDYMVEWNKRHGIYNYIFLLNDMAIFIFLYP
jgi:hypothetical protein